MTASIIAISVLVLAYFIWKTPMMIIDKISKQTNSHFIVKLKPTWLGKLVGLKPSIQHFFKKIGCTYWNSGEQVWITTNKFILNENDFIVQALNDYDRTTKTKENLVICLN